MMSKQPHGFVEVAPAHLIAESVTPTQQPNYRIVDVRQADEFDGELGHIEGAELVPLDALGAAAETWQRSQRLLLVCRSGSRSGRGCALLVSLGFVDVTNLRGGMLAWNEATA